MKILFINNWGLDNALTISTTLPALRILAQSPRVDQIAFVTPEHLAIDTELGIDKVLHSAVRLDKCSWPSMLNYICWERQYQKVLLDLTRKYAFDRIIARGAPAGGRAWWLHKKTGIPFYVESFEPHADYMSEAGVWNKVDPRYLVQKHWEKEAIEHAAGLMPVAENYRNLLLHKGVPAKNVRTIPCTVDVNAFAHSVKERHRIRGTLGIPPNSIVGIYVGKFGDLYYDEKAFEAFEIAFENIPDFQLILLSPISDEKLQQSISNHPNIDAKRIHHFLVKPFEVPGYLSASDFAYEFHRAKPSTLYCSPIKVGEYWANGLPIIISKGVGDDAQIIQQTKTGGVFDPAINNHKQALDKVLAILKTEHKEAIVALAQQYRSRHAIEEGYREMGFI